MKVKEVKSGYLLQQKDQEETMDTKAEQTRLGPKAEMKIKDRPLPARCEFFHGRDVLQVTIWVTLSASEN